MFTHERRAFLVKDVSVASRQGTRSCKAALVGLSAMANRRYDPLLAKQQQQQLDVPFGEEAGHRSRRRQPGGREGSAGAREPGKFGRRRERERGWKPAAAPHCAGEREGASPSCGLRERRGAARRLPCLTLGPLHYLLRAPLGNRLHAPPRSSAFPPGGGRVLPSSPALPNPAGIRAPLPLRSLLCPGPQTFPPLSGSLRSEPPPRLPPSQAGPPRLLGLARPPLLGLLLHVQAAPAGKSARAARGALQQQQEPLLCPLQAEEKEGPGTRRREREASVQCGG